MSLSLGFNPQPSTTMLGIKTGMRVKDGQAIYPGLKILPPDPDKYRHVHYKFKQLLLDYSTDVAPKSIDEFAINLQGFPALQKGIKNVAQEIKDRLRAEIGDWLTISIGIGPNRYLAKIAAGLKKPDGLEEICIDNYEQTYSRLKLTDLTGIKKANASRLNSVGIFNVSDFYTAKISTLRHALHSIGGYYWYLRLHGWEIDNVDFQRRSFGNMYSLPKPLWRPDDLAPILHKYDFFSISPNHYFQNSDGKVSKLNTSPYM